MYDATTTECFSDNDLTKRGKMIIFRSLFTTIEVRSIFEAAAGTIAKLANQVPDMHIRKDLT